MGIDIKWYRGYNTRTMIAEEEIKEILQPDTSRLKLRCPECGYTQLIKDGWINRRGGKVQRWICKRCFRTTVHPIFRRGGQSQAVTKVDKRSTGIRRASTKEVNEMIKAHKDE